MREMMLFEDLPSYYDHEAGFITFQVCGRDVGAVVLEPMHCAIWGQVNTHDRGQGAGNDHDQ